MPRITATAKKETRQRIIDVACKLFRSQGFDESTTRDIATRAEIATGTLFNYFPTKEAIVMTLVDESLNRARVQFGKQRHGDATLEEDLFLSVSTGLRTMKRHRKYIRPVLESALSPLASGTTDNSESIRLGHLESVQAILRTHLQKAEVSPTAMHLYWTLYTGVLAFWADDNSPNQEDTLAMLDQSIAMFVSWLTARDGSNCR